MTTLLLPLAPPCHISPSAATLASLPTLTGSPMIFDKVPATSISPHPRFTHLVTTLALSTGPGTPIPIPCTSSLLMPSLLSFSSIVFAMSGRIASPPLAVFVLISHLSRSAPLVSKKPTLTVVPPTSIPKPYFFTCSSSNILYREILVLYYHSKTVRPMII